MRSSPDRWNALIVLVATLIVASACRSTGSGYTYKHYPGPVLASHEIATLQLARGLEWLEIDGMRIAHSDFELIAVVPGTHEIRWSSVFGQSNPSSPSREAVLRHEFVAGHHYVIHLKAPQGGQPWLWIRNRSTPEVIRE